VELADGGSKNLDLDLLDADEARQVIGLSRWVRALGYVF